MRVFFLSPLIKDLGKVNRKKPQVSFGVAAFCSLQYRVILETVGNEGWYLMAWYILFWCIPSLLKFSSASSTWRPCNNLFHKWNYRYLLRCSLFKVVSGGLCSLPPFWVMHWLIIDGCKKARDRSGPSEVILLLHETVTSGALYQGPWRIKFLVLPLLIHKKTLMKNI